MEKIIKQARHSAGMCAVHKVVLISLFPASLIVVAIAFGIFFEYTVSRLAFLKVCGIFTVAVGIISMIAYLLSRDSKGLQQAAIRRRIKKNKEIVLLFKGMSDASYKDPYFGGKSFDECLREYERYAAMTPERKAKWIAHLDTTKNESFNSFDFKLSYKNFEARKIFKTQYTLFLDQLSAASKTLFFLCQANVGQDVSFLENIFDNILFAKETLLKQFAAQNESSTFKCEQEIKEMCEVLNAYYGVEFGSETQVQFT